MGNGEWKKPISSMSVNKLQAEKAEELRYRTLLRLVGSSRAGFQITFPPEKLPTLQISEFRIQRAGWWEPIKLPSDF